ncbi:MAG: 3,4-dihydroxy-2-butanone-4-phosphate synthase [Sulfolobales archaeon]|nr:3,4-dihydroxy-2-butanone-4-phosphate synthase [Sulfolobales archaeon]MCX8198817.1 3,4-dihydroxy-2-butanone-4-phosphate synthase [Sulfolobales archaeon]MDW8170785.1 3,4-dihydroxy-2-butanone-4-phosphate synthase [Desulfurococcaceae archaeon]
MDLLRIRSALLRGEPILVFDSLGREAETDMVFYAGSIDEAKVIKLRKDAGGLICYVSGRVFRESLGIEFINDLFTMSHKDVYRALGSRKPGYGDPPAFNLWVNHVETKTGITDRDRVMTIRRLHVVACNVYKGSLEEARRIFLTEFYAPGHVPILTSRGLKLRRGHTELVTALALITGVVPSMVIAEMLSDGIALPYEDARKYAEDYKLLFIDGSEIASEAERRDLVND